jgi:hypothetical protein
MRGVANVLYGIAVHAGRAYFLHSNCWRSLTAAGPKLAMNQLILKKVSYASFSE